MDDIVKTIKNILDRLRTLEVGLATAFKVGATIFSFDKVASQSEVPVSTKIFLYAKNDNKLYFMASDGVEHEVGAGGGSTGATWGNIIGTLADQTDLVNALAGKASTSHNHDSSYEAKNSNIQTHIGRTDNPHSTTANQVLPTQTGNGGKFLKTDGSNSSWADPALSAVANVNNETPSGTMNGVNLTFTLANTPLTNTLKLFHNRTLLKLTEDYSISGATITLVDAPIANDMLVAFYDINTGNYAVGAGVTRKRQAFNETPDGSRTVFTVPTGIYLAGSTYVYLDGQLQSVGSGGDYTESTPASGQITFATAPLATMNLEITYDEIVSTAGNADMVDGKHANPTPTANNLLVLDSSGKIPSGAFPTQTWTSPTLLNSWVYYGSWSPVGYYKDQMGIVHLRGLVKSGTINAAIFTLPTGYRPAADAIFAGSSIDAYCRINVSNAGNVIPINGNNSWVCLDGITFLAEA